MAKSSYFRRCHVCGEMNHIDEIHHIEKCHTCGKSMARFVFFDDRLTPILSDRTLRPAPLINTYIPVQGLTVYWEAF